MKIKQLCSFSLLFIIALTACSQPKKDTTMTFNKLTPAEERVIVNKGTEAPFTGEYYRNTEKGIYHCKRCNAALYRSEDKFDAHCGWPSFDDEIKGAVKRIPDADGQRVEIVCNSCDAHLGHVFTGERFTEKDTRHCVNSISMTFVKGETMADIQTDTAIFAGGCFWGVQYYFEINKGVISSTVGYIGGHVDNPTYEDVCSHRSGHIEAMKVVFDPKIISYRDLAILFFEIHDFTQVNRQGPDVGEQYRSEIFYLNENQKKTSEELIQILTGKGYKVATILSPATKFWDAEGYHQHYYEKKGGRPYCHAYKKVF
jgi:peptide methionine sulfoxide reductase msrA/msrB